MAHVDQSPFPDDCTTTHLGSAPNAPCRHHLTSWKGRPRTITRLPHTFVNVSVLSRSSYVSSGNGAAQDSRLKTQDSRLKTQDSRLKTPKNCYTVQTQLSTG